MERRIDLSGKRFGRLVVDRYDKTINKRPWWICRCDCGAHKSVPGINLRKGKTSSCGCLQRELSAKRVASHGMTGTRAHKSWLSMRNRCERKGNNSYKDYGAKGIKVCDRWRSFDLFYADMGDCPEGKTIDRIDNTKGYEPGNCRWATAREQSLNRSTNRILEHSGIVMTAGEWADKLGVPPYIIYNRLASGWSVERTLSTKRTKYRTRAMASINRGLRKHDADKADARRNTEK